MKFGATKTSKYVTGKVNPDLTGKYDKDPILQKKLADAKDLLKRVGTPPKSERQGKAA